ncbi:MAG: GHKL domain-containing protein [Lachnospiraceae bacterium]|nr:GHKL domain-containing protein [Robinsoniella sp.]MDY3765253.1 GHKL domain-containing protein [Lachnospiraceae bacterium]
MINVRQIRQLYQLPDIQAINIIGQFLDAFLFIYLIQNFFEPKQKEYRSRKSWATEGTLFAFLLFLTDWVTKNNFYAYVVIMLVFPFIYACIFFEGKIQIKALVCLIFFTMVYSQENLVTYISYYLSDNWYLDMGLWRMLFIVRRIVFKGILYLEVKVLMIDVMRARTKVMNGYWYFMAGVCVIDYTIVTYVLRHSINDKTALTQGLILSVFCNLVPIACYYMVSLIIKIGEINQVTVAQKTWIQMQEQYLEQMEEMQQTIRQFRHDYTTHLFCIDTLVLDQNYEELHRYLEQLHQTPMEELAVIPYTVNNSLNLLLNQKRKMAEKYGIDFEVNAEIDNPSEHGEKVQIYDLNILVSNLCDNAIEAAAKVDKGKVSLHMMRKKAYLKIEIENSTDGNVLQKNPEFETTKMNREFHGLGIQIIKNIVRRYDGMYETAATQHCLKTSIMLMNE